MYLDLKILVQNALLIAFPSIVVAAFILILYFIFYLYRFYRFSLKFLLYKYQ